MQKYCPKTWATAKTTPESGSSIRSAESAAPASSPDQLPRSLDALYRRIIEILPHRLAALLAMTANAEGPVLVHCTAGKDRTGIAVAVLLLAGGVEAADGVADYTATGPNVPALLDRLRALGRTLPAGVQAGSELLGARPLRSTSWSNG